MAATGTISATFHLVRTACSDGADSDGDGFTDFPADTACTGPTE